MWHEAEESDMMNGVAIFAYRADVGPLSACRRNILRTRSHIGDLKEPLLGRPAMEALKLIERVNSVDKENKYKQEFPELFIGLGRMKIVYTIRLQENAQPFAISTPRRLPIPMKEKNQEELKKLEKLDIIRPVETPTDWCAPIVAVPKSNGKVRLCIDITKLNESVHRENFPLPTTDQLLAQLDGATEFNKLDCNSGFHQIPLHRDSQELTTFITPFGLYCYKRLVWAQVQKFFTER